MMGGRIDLHLHSTASDGVLEPGALVAFLKSEGIGLFSLTDHDTVAGLAEAREAADRLGLEMIPGIELSTGDEIEVHLLGYGINAADEGLLGLLSRLRRQRRERLSRMLGLLRGMGVEADEGDFEAGEEASLGRMHMARLLVEKGVVADTAQAFDLYLTHGKPLYVKRPVLRLSDAIAAVRAAGGVAVLAHPGLVKLPAVQLEALLASARKDGLEGIECYHASHTPQMAEAFVRMAVRLGLVVTGGSDYHGGRPGEVIGRGLEGWQSAEADARRLIARINDKAR